MELAISNIAWLSDEEKKIASILGHAGVRNIELAPTKYWNDPGAVSIDEARKLVKWWSDYDINVVAFQSMLFLRPDLHIFDDYKSRKDCEEYLENFIGLAGMMNVKKMVFGSPKNRQIGSMKTEEARNIAVDFFRRIANAAKKNNVIFCIEPNASVYGCDFITNAKEGDSIVREVNHSNFRLHLDTACMSLARDNFKDSILESADILEHFHVSSPMLSQVEERKDVSHHVASSALKKIGYKGYVSIEMRPMDDGKNIDRVLKAIEFTKKNYIN